jgi:hypothetical protein
VHDAKVGIFTKREKMIKRKPYAPRLIGGCSVPVKVVVGPFMHALSKAVKSELDGSTPLTPDGNITLTYGAGLDAVVLGHWYEDAHERDNAALIVCGDDLYAVDNRKEKKTQGAVTGTPRRTTYCNQDGSKHDHKMLVEDLEAGADYYERRGASAEVLEWARNTKHKFTSVKGVSARTVGRQVSGLPTTTIANSLSTAARTYAFLSQDQDEHGEPDLKTFLSVEFGYPITGGFTSRACDTDFLSGCFWPAEVAGKLTTIWGPLPGRMIARIGVTTNVNAKLGQLRGTMLGLEAYAWVPALGEVITQCLYLTQGMTASFRGAGKEPSRRPTLVTEVNRCHETLQFFLDRYQITETEFVTSMDKLARIDALPFVSNDGFLRHIVEADLGFN